MKYHKLTFSSKTDCTNKFSIPELSENSPFQVSNINHDDRNNYQVNLDCMETPGNLRKNSVMMKYHKLTYILIKT